MRVNRPISSLSKGFINDGTLSGRTVAENGSSIFRITDDIQEIKLSKRP